MNRLTPMKVMLNFRDKLRFAFQVSARRMPRHYFLTLLTYHNLGGSARTKGGSGLFQSSFGPGPNLYSGSGHELRRHISTAPPRDPLAGQVSWRWQILSCGVAVAKPLQLPALDDA